MNKLENFSFLKLPLWFALAFCFSLNLHAQDIHFSQYFNNPLNQNPANTAFFPSNARFILSHRNQWGSVTVPYMTYSASFDFKMINIQKKGWIVGLGVLFNKDEAGDSKFGTTQGAFNLSIIKAVNRSNKNVISIGFQSGYSQRSIDYSQLQFAQQWNGTYNDPTLTSIENFTVEAFNYLDFSAGALWFYSFNNDLSMTNSVSVWHLNRPYQNLMTDIARLNIKTSFNTDWEINLSRTYKVMPSILFQVQGNQSELIVGSRFAYMLRQSTKDNKSLSFGLFYRNSDAIILYSGFDVQSWKFNISYDFNVSSLSAASNFMGGLELNAQFLINKKKKLKTINAIPCPVF